MRSRRPWTPNWYREVLDTIRLLASEGMTMLIVSHEMGFIREVSSQVAFMADGKVVEIGAPEAVFDAPSEARTQDFVCQDSEALTVSHSINTKPGAKLLQGAVDCHVHACPHLNQRSVTVLEAVRNAAAAGMRGIGLMDNFANTSGYAALAMRELGHLGVDVFGGLIMEPPAGGISADAVRIALAYGYGPGDGARFISLPTHHTRNIARQEGRSLAYIETCLEIPEAGELCDELLAILDLVALHDAVLNTGHVSGTEAIRLVEIARGRGVQRILVPSSYYTPDEVRALAGLGAVTEHSFFFVSHATQAGLTHVDAMANTVAPVSAPRIVELIRAAGPQNAIISSDCGVFLLPPPDEGLREFALLLESCGLTQDDLKTLMQTNPAKLFKVPPTDGPTPT